MTTTMDRTAARDVRVSSSVITFGFVVGCLALAGLVVALCYVSTQGLSPRLANPHPFRRVEPWMGFEYWPEAFQAMSVVFCATLWACFVRLSLARGKMHPLFVAMAGVTVMTLLDPVATWATINVQHPRMWHFPDTWPWFNIQPAHQPIYMFISYPYFFLTAVVIGRFVHGQLSKRASAGSFLHRRPLLSTVLVVYLTSLVTDFLIETNVGKTGVLIYPQVIGSLSLWPGTYYQFPLYTPPMVSIMMGFTAALAWEDASGRTLVERRIEAWHLSKGAAAFSKLALTSALLLVGYFVLYCLPWWALRESHLQTTIARPWPYDNMAVYDPDGLYQKAGEPGPYVTDEWSVRPAPKHVVSDEQGH